MINQTERIHTPFIMTNKQTKRNRAIALTHLYIKDEKRFKQVRKGNIMITTLKEFETPTGVQNYYYSQNTKGKKINLKDADVVKIHKRYLPKKQADKMKMFAKRNKK